MEDAKKIKLFRLLAIVLLLIPLGLSIWFFVYYLVSKNEGIGLHVFTTGVLIVFLLLQEILFIKNMKKQLVIYDIAFNENKSVNKTAVIFVGVGGLIGLGASIASGVLYFTLGEVQQKLTMMLLFVIFLFLLINSSIFLLFTLLFRQKEFKIEDLLK